VAGWTSGADPFFGALGLRPERAADPGVAVIAAEPGTAEWGEIESRWLEPTLVDLRTGRITRLVLSAGDRQYGISRRGSRRFWRRRRPWWEFFS
jgi:hypothetical protein